MVRQAGAAPAGGAPSDALLVWGDGTHAGTPAAPGGLHDVYARVGGPDTAPVAARAMLRVRSGHVVASFWDEYNLYLPQTR